jgi:hypothetical protein
MLHDVNWWIVGPLLGLIGLVLIGRWLHLFGRSVQIERARELFRLQHERFEGLLITAAAATGKPRGLIWTSCEITGNAVLARNAERRIVALVPVIIHFEPVAGSDMEHVPAAREPRIATAVFTYHRGHWETDGRVVFNLDPPQALAHLTGLAPIEAHH